MFFLATPFETLNRSISKEDAANDLLDVRHYSLEHDTQWPGRLARLRCAFAEASGQQEFDGASQHQRVSKKIRIPYKPRGVWTKHATTFFDIALEAAPSQPQCCSHPECAAGGKTLHFCSVCEKPIAMCRGPGVLLQSSKELNKDRDVNELRCSAVRSSLSSLCVSSVAHRHRQVASPYLSYMVEEKDVPIKDKEQRKLLRQGPGTEYETKMTAWMDTLKPDKQVDQPIASPVTPTAPAAKAETETAGAIDMEQTLTFVAGVADLKFSTGGFVNHTAAEKVENDMTKERFGELDEETRMSQQCETHKVSK